jgi:hypothetical protein
VPLTFDSFLRYPLPVGKVGVRKRWFGSRPALEGSLGAARLADWDEADGPVGLDGVDGRARLGFRRPLRTSVRHLVVVTQPELFTDKVLLGHPGPDTGTLHLPGPRPVLTIAASWKADAPADAVARGVALARSRPGPVLEIGKLAQWVYAFVVTGRRYVGGQGLGR